MSLYYLARQHKLTDNNAFPCAQLINVPELQGTQRCNFCVHFEYNRTLADYQACMKKQLCGAESLFYTSLYNSLNATRVPNPAHFSPTPLIRQTEIDSVKRYLQLWSCDIPGYVCNSRCQFYAARLSKEESVATCSNSHGCGANGSFLDLLQVYRTILFALPNIYNVQLAVNKFYLANGQLINVYLSDIYIAGGGFLLAVFSDGSEYRILNMIPTAARAGYAAFAPSSDFKQTQFSVRVLPNDMFRGLYVLMTDIARPIASMLRNKGVFSAAITNALGETAKVTAYNGTTCYISQYASEFQAEYVGNDILAGTYDIDANYKFVFKLGSTGYYLAMRPNQWGWRYAYRIKFSGSVPEDVTVYTISQYDDSVARVLRAAGCRNSLFYNL